MKNQNHSGLFKNKKKRFSQFAASSFLLLLVSFVLTAIMVLYLNHMPSNIFEGGIATQDIRADQNYEIVDTEGSKKLRDQAEMSSPRVYDFNTDLVRTRTAAIELAFTIARQHLQNLKAFPQDRPPLSAENEANLKQEFLTNLGSTIPDADYRLIRQDSFSSDLENALITLSAVIQKRPIIHDKEELPSAEDMGIVLRKLASENEVTEEYMANFEHIMNLTEARDFFGKEDLAPLQKKHHLDFVDAETIKLSLRLLPGFIVVNVTINQSETESRKERAKLGVENIVHKLQKGQNIILRGERFTKRHLTILNGIRESHLKANIIFKFIGIFSLVVITLLALYFFGNNNIGGFRPTRKDLCFLSVMAVLFMAILRFASFVGSSLQGALPFAVDITTFYYIFPMAAGAMIVRNILSAEIALFFAMVLTLFVGMFLEFNFAITTYYFLSSIVGAHLINQVEKRSTVISRGLVLGFVNALLVLGISFVTSISSSGSIDMQVVAIDCVFGFSGGLLCSLTLLAVSPIMETIFTYTTNIQLLELANMNHPLLRDMIVRAPGTYHHSHLVGVLAEAGARAISANPLLARVCSYYHDIGKVNKPLYFVENQRGENPHDHLSPSMSALIVASHVKEGVEMAAEHKLPKVIADCIPEHQGTKLISYFFQKAKQMQSDEAGEIEEKDYRYQGPKPQSRESGVVMLADTIEAAVRSLPDKSPQKIRAQVEKLVNSHFVDGQLNECELTLRDLNLINEAFVKTLIGGIYHQRVEYPEDSKKHPLAVVSNTVQTGSDTGSGQPTPQTDNIAPLFKEKRKQGSLPS